MPTKLKVNKDGTCEVPAFSLHQNDKEMVCFVLAHDDFAQLKFVEQFDEGNKKGNQRKLYDDHVLQFAESINDFGKSRPQSIVGTLTGGAKFVPSHPGFGKIIFPKKSGNFISIQDGQHSISALEYVDESIRENWEWAVTAYKVGDWKDRAQVHIGVNAYQKKTDKSHLLHQQIVTLDETMDPASRRVGKILIEINDNEESVLYNRIKLYDSQKKRLSFDELIKNFTVAARMPAIQAISDDQLLNIIHSYLNLWKEENEVIWNDKGNFIMSNILGIKVISKFFPELIKYLVYKGEPITKENMRKVIQRAKTYSMNWAKTSQVQQHGHQVVRHLLAILIQKTRISLVKNAKEVEA